MPPGSANSSYQTARFEARSVFELPAGLGCEKESENVEQMREEE